jgi:hypothetical protein
MSPAASRYPVTTREPGASEVLTVGPTRRPRATAFRASSPAPTITVGLDVFVHDVIAAMATEPCRTIAPDPPISMATLQLSVAPVVPPSSVRRPRSSFVDADGAVAGKAARKLAGSPGSSTRSCGRRGPATDGATLARSSSRCSSNAGPWPGSRHKPWVFA